MTALLIDISFLEKKKGQRVGERKRIFPFLFQIIEPEMLAGLARISALRFLETSTATS